MKKVYLNILLVLIVVSACLYVVVPEKIWKNITWDNVLEQARESFQLLERSALETESEESGSLTESIHTYIDSLIVSNKQSRIHSIDISNTDSVDHYRNRLAQLLGVPADCIQTGVAEKSHSTIHSIEEVTRGSAGTVHRVEFSLCGGQFISTGLLGIPNDTDSSESMSNQFQLKGDIEGRKAPVVVAIHGTAAGPETLFRGNDFLPRLDDEGLYDAEDYHNSMGTVLMEHGFVVFAPQLVTNAVYDQVTHYNRFRNQLHNRLESLGLSLHGIEAGVLMASLDALESSSVSQVVDFSRLGTYGISLGGATAFYLAALDTRIDAAVISQWAEDRDGKLLGRDYPDNLWNYHWTDYAIINDYSRYFDDVVLAGLVLPRGLFIEAGEDDGHRAVMARQLFFDLNIAYGEGLPVNTLCFEYAKGGHETLLNGSLQWLQATLADRVEELDSFCIER